VKMLFKFNVLLIQPQASSDIAYRNTGILLARLLLNPGISGDAMTTSALPDWDNAAASPWPLATRYLHPFVDLSLLAFKKY